MKVLNIHAPRKCLEVTIFSLDKVAEKGIIKKFYRESKYVKDMTNVNKVSYNNKKKNSVINYINKIVKNIAKDSV